MPAVGRRRTPIIQKPLLLPARTPLGCPPSSAFGPRLRRPEIAVRYTNRPPPRYTAPPCLRAGLGMRSERLPQSRRGHPNITHAGPDRLPPRSAVETYSLPVPPRPSSLSQDTRIALGPRPLRA